MKPVAATWVCVCGVAVLLPQSEPAEAERGEAAQRDQRPEGQGRAAEEKYTPVTVRLYLCRTSLAMHRSYFRAAEEEYPPVISDT